MSGLYLLTQPLMNETFKIGCSTNINQRMKSGDYCTMFDPDNGPELKGWISVDGYETPSEVRYLEQSVFHQLSHKRLFKRRELFKNVTIQEIAECITNLELTPKIHYEIPIDNGIKDKQVINFGKISIKRFQVPILASMKSYFDSNDRGKLILPCGYGKMYLSLFLIKEKFNTVIIVCPSILLCQQFVEVAKQICIDHSIGLRETNKWIIITTYHSINDFKDNKPDLLVVDEAHHLCVTSRSAKEESLFRSVLKFNAKKYLFMTATEKILRDISVDTIIKIEESSFDEEEDEEEEEEEEENFDSESNKDSDSESLKLEKFWYSMDGKLYGKEIYRKDFSQAINEGVISDYRLAIVNSGDPIRVVITARQALGLKWLLTYHNCRKSAGKFCQQLNSVGIATFYLDGNMTLNQRTVILQTFENTPYSVLCSVCVLAEGISLPFVDSVYFVDPRGSEIDIIQRVGRSLRIYKDKSLATVILPENILEYAALLKSLIVYDPKTRDLIRNKIIGLGFLYNNLSSKTKFIDIESQLDICIMGRLDAQWNVKWKLAMKYENENKKIITQKLQYEGVNIGMWVGTQKVPFDNMLEDRKTKIMQLITIQKWLETRDNNPRKIQMSWEDKFSLCLEYEKSNAIIEQRTVYLEIKIGFWIGHQKQTILGKGKSAKLTEIKLEKLSQLRTIKDWHQETVQDVSWMNTWQSCLEFEQRTKSTIKQRSTNGSINIGQWLDDQKRFIRGKHNNAMTELRLNKLFELITIKEWYAEIKQDLKWVNNLQLCIEYEDLKKMIIKHKTKYLENNIGGWLSTQKSATTGAVKSNMNENRIIQLLSCKAYYDWYIVNQNGCLPQFRGYHLNNESSHQIETISYPAELNQPTIVGPLFEFEIIPYSPKLPFQMEPLSFPAGLMMNSLSPK